MVKELFRRTPLQQFTHYSDSHAHASAAYMARFRVRPGRAAMWKMEARLLERIFKCLAPHRVLDFATGTGRIARALESCLPDCELHGVDISSDMLDVARENCTHTKLHQMDGRQALDAFGPEAFDAISAFRFFANAEPSLRMDAAGQIAGLLRPGGHVVVNNHRSFWSASYVLMRAAGHRDGCYGCRNAEIKQLFAAHGLQLAGCHSLGIWPQTENRSFLLPWRATHAIERFNLCHLSTMHTLGYNTIFVFRKPPNQPARREQGPR